MSRVRGGNPFERVSQYNTTKTISTRVGKLVSMRESIHCRWFCLLTTSSCVHVSAKRRMEIHRVFFFFVDRAIPIDGCATSSVIFNCLIKRSSPGGNVSGDRCISFFFFFNLWDHISSVVPPRSRESSERRSIFPSTDHARVLLDPDDSEVFLKRSLNFFSFCYYRRFLLYFPFIFNHTASFARFSKQKWPDCYFEAS